MRNTKKISSEQFSKLQNITSRIIKVYDGIECNNFKGSCLNAVRQSLEYLCIFTCDIYDIKITRRTKTEISKATIENALNSMYIVTNWFYLHYEQECPIKPKNTHNYSEEEKEFNNKTNLLYEQLAVLQQKDEEFAATEKEPTKIDEDDFSDIYFDDLLEAIEAGQCVLFIGPNLSVDENDNNLHEKFYKKISRRNIEFNERDGFFMPQAEKQIEGYPRKVGLLIITKLQGTLKVPCNCPTLRG